LSLNRKIILFVKFLLAVTVATSLDHNSTINREEPFRVIEIRIFYERTSIGIMVVEDENSLKAYIR
jgi:hypothetical protein